MRKTIYLREFGPSMLYLAKARDVDWREHIHLYIAIVASKTSAKKSLHPTLFFPPKFSKPCRTMKKVMATQWWWWWRKKRWWWRTRRRCWCWCWCWWWWWWWWKWGWLSCIQLLFTIHHSLQFINNSSTSTPKQQSSNHQITCNQTKLTLFFTTQFFFGTQKPNQAWIFSLFTISTTISSDQEGGWGEGLQLPRVLPRNNIGIDVVHVSSLDEGLTWEFTWLFFGKHTRKTHDFLTFGQNVWPAKYPRKSADHHHPEGGFTVRSGNRNATKTPPRKTRFQIPSLELPRVFAARKTFLIYSPKQIETKSGSKKSPTVGPTERTPKKTWVSNGSIATYLGVRWEGPIQFLMGRRNGGFQVRFISFSTGGERFFSGKVTSKSTF